MDYKNIPAIVARYWEGETSLEEELFLKEYFKNEEVSEEMKSHQSYFQALHQEKQMKLDASFEERLMAKLTSESIAIEKEISPPSIPIRSTNRRFALSRIAAAAVLILVSLYFLLRPNLSPREKPVLAIQDTYQTPEEAYEEVRQLLSMVSTRLNKGTDQAAKGVLKMQETSNLFKTK